MDNAKEYFDSAEFRKLLKKYEQMNRGNICSYLEAEELSDLLSYYLYKGDSAAADAVYTYAKRLHPASDEITRMEVRMALSAGEPEKALRLLEKIEDNDDDTLLLRAEIMLALKNYKAARSIAKSILQREDLRNDAAYDAFEIMLDCGFARDALQIVERGLQQHPTHKNLLEIKAECLIEIQQIDEAVELYNHLLDDNPYSTFYWEQLGHIYYMVERYGKALECFEYELTIDENIDYAKMMSAYCLYHLRSYKKAQTIFEELSEKFPDSIQPRFYTALSLSMQEKPEEALNAYNKIISMSIKKENHDIETMLALLNIAMILDENGTAKEALAVATEAIGCQPDPEEMKQLLLLDKNRYFELRDKENLTFRDMNIMEQKEWKREELLYRLGESLFDSGHCVLSMPPFSYVRLTAYDSAEAEAYIAYIYHASNSGIDIKENIVAALNGKSNKLFELFDIPYDSNITADDFIRQIKKSGASE